METGARDEELDRPGYAIAQDTEALHAVWPDVGLRVRGERVDSDGGVRVVAGTRT